MAHCLTNPPGYMYKFPKFDDFIKDYIKFAPSTSTDPIPLDQQLYHEIYFTWIPDLIVRAENVRFLDQRKIHQWFPDHAYVIFETLMIEYNIPSRLQFEQKPSAIRMEVEPYYKVLIYILIYCSIILYYANLTYDMMIQTMQQESFIIRHLTTKITERILKPNKHDFLVKIFIEYALPSLEDLQTALDEQVAIIANIDYLLDSKSKEKINKHYELFYYTHMWSARTIIETYVYIMDFAKTLTLAIDNTKLLITTLANQLKERYQHYYSNFFERNKFYIYVVHQSYISSSHWKELASSLLCAIDSLESDIRRGSTLWHQFWEFMIDFGVKAIKLPLI